MTVRSFTCFLIQGDDGSVLSMLVCWWRARGSDGELFQIMYIEGWYSCTQPHIHQCAGVNLVKTALTPMVILWWLSLQYVDLSMTSDLTSETLWEQHTVTVMAAGHSSDGTCTVRQNVRDLHASPADRSRIEWDMLCSITVEDENDVSIEGGREADLISSLYRQCCRTSVDQSARSTRALFHVSRQ